MGRKKKYEEVEYYSLSPETKKGIFIVLLFALALICILSFLNLAGRVGLYIDWGLGIGLGFGRYLLPFILMGVGYVLARPSRYKISLPTYLGICLFVLSLHGLLNLNNTAATEFSLPYDGLGGGMLGYLIMYPLNLYIGFFAAIVILLAAFFASILLMFNTGFEKIMEKINPFRLFSSSNEENPEEDLVEEKTPALTSESPQEESAVDEHESRATEVKWLKKDLLAESKQNNYTPIKSAKLKVDLPLSLLDDRPSKPTSGDIKLGAERIKTTLENFNIPVEMGEVQIGPTVTQYTLKPAEGIKLSRITALNNDLALSLAAHPIRIEAPIPGKSLVGIEVPNKKPAIVRVREILDSPEFKARKSNLTIALGKDVSGKCWSDDLSQMPHMLVAGATGSGKSVCLNSIIISLIYQNKPETLRLILVDPKRVELPIYNGIPHLLTPVITDVTKTVYALRWAITEMDNRFDLLSQTNKRNIESYNLVHKDKLPHIIIIIDELADLMVAASAEVEGCIIRLTQMARAIGIHLIVATQRPSVDIITGLIKANIPCRIAFSVASLVDSRTILDSSGAEKLVGKGDMLFMTPKIATPKRLQGAYVSDEEIKRVVEFLKNACEEPAIYNESVVNKPSGHTSFDFQAGDNDDELYEEAKNLIIHSGKASASFLQRRLRVGYARAARLIDLMEEAGVVGPADGAKPREILVDKSQIYSSQPISFKNIENDEEPIFDELNKSDSIETTSNLKDTFDLEDSNIEDHEEDSDEEEHEEATELITKQKNALSATNNQNRSTPKRNDSESEDEEIY